MRLLTLLLIAIFVQACSEPEQPASSQLKVPALKSDPQRFTRGMNLYQQNCAACHGKQAEGAPNWQQKTAEGKFRPPPLNGTGHTWHHPMYMLMDIIRNGTGRFGGDMPAWKERLSDEEIQDILYAQMSQWPQEIYATWYRYNEEVNVNRKGLGGVE